MKYKVSEKRAKFLDENFFEFSFNEKTPDKSIFDAITEAVELHYIADKFNWDDGPEVLNWIVNSPICDKGTAKLIFWRAQPDHYTRFADPKEADHDADVYELLRDIIDNFENNFYKSERIFYDPRQDSAISDVDYINPNTKWTIPEHLKTPSKGRTVQTTTPGLADLIKYRRILSPVITTEIDGNVLHSPELKFKFNLNFKWHLADNSTYENFVANHELIKGVKGKYSSTPKEIKKSLFPPIAILKSDKQFAVLYAFDRKGMTGESLVNVANLLWYDLGNIGAFVKTKKIIGEAVPKRFKVNNYRAAVSNPIIFEYEEKDTISQDYELRLLYIDKEDIIFAFYLFASLDKKIEETEIDDLTNRITLYQ